MTDRFVWIVMLDYSGNEDPSDVIAVYDNKKSAFEYVESIIEPGKYEYEECKIWNPNSDGFEYEWRELPGGWMKKCYVCMRHPLKT